MSKFKALMTVASLAFLAGCGSSSPEILPSVSSGPADAATTPVATPTTEPLDMAEASFVLTATRQDGSHVAIPIALDGAAGNLVELGSAQKAVAFRLDDRGMWVFTSNQCGEVCVGEWSVINLATGESQILAKDFVEPGTVQVVDGVIYDTIGCCGTNQTLRVDGADMPWRVNSIDTAMFSPDGSLVWRSVGEPEDEQLAVSLFSTGATSTAADELTGLPGTALGWVDDTTMLLATTDAEYRLSGLFLYDAVTRSATPLPLAAANVSVSVEPGGVLVYWPDSRAAGGSLVFAKTTGTVLGSLPWNGGAAIATLNTTNGGLVAALVTGAQDESYRYVLADVGLVDVETGVETPVTGVPGDVTWLESLVAASS